VYWLLVVLFLIAFAATLYWFKLYVRDVMIEEELLVAGRFDRVASLRITGACFASLALTSGVLFAHYKRADHYGSPLELFFGVVFGLCLPMALICLLPYLV
jgi:hypothetical protein